MAGKWVVKDLLEQGHRVLNLDRVPLQGSAARTLITDLTDAGQVFNALASSTIGHEFAGNLKPAPVDAIIPFRRHSADPDLPGQRGLPQST